MHGLLTRRGDSKNEKDLKKMENSKIQKTNENKVVNVFINLLQSKKSFSYPTHIEKSRRPNSLLLTLSTTSPVISN